MECLYLSVATCKLSSQSGVIPACQCEGQIESIFICELIFVVVVVAVDGLSDCDLRLLKEDFGLVNAIEYQYEDQNEA